MKILKQPSVSDVLQRNLSSDVHPEILIEELRRSHSRFQTLFNLCREAMLIVDPDSSIILDANNESGRLLEYNKKDLPGRKLSLIFPRQSRLFSKLCQDAFDKTRAQTGRLYATTASKERLPLQTSAWPIDHAKAVELRQRNRCRKVSEAA